uniref:BACK domain-containing protein n=1 Tax=Syphacia muris TaxID=451379 RepID=A0A0N5AKA3_9BILA
MFDVASYLLLDPLLDFLSHEIERLVDYNTLIPLLRFAERRHLPLARRIWEMILHNFDKLYECKSFITLTESEMLKILQDYRTNITRYEEKAIIEEWLFRNKSSRVAADPNSLRAWLAHRVSIAGVSSCRRVPHKILLATGGFSNDATDVVEIFDSNCCKWFLSNFRLRKNIAYHQSVIINGDLYTIGGCDGSEYRNETSQYNFTKFDVRKIGCMHSRRCYVSCALLSENTIIAAGGHDGFLRQKSAEIFYIPTNQWTLTSEMKRRSKKSKNSLKLLYRSDGNCVMLNGIAYVIGGFDGNNCLDSLEYYDCMQNRWTTIRKPMSEPRSGLGSVALGNAIFVCGGFDRRKRLGTSALFDPREGRWHSMAEMKVGRSNFGIELLNEQVVVAGGYTRDKWGAGVMNVCEAYDIRANCWMELPPLNQAKSALRVSYIDDYGTIVQLYKTVESENFGFSFYDY